MPFRQDGQWLWAVSPGAGRLSRPALGTVMTGFRAGPGLMPTVSALAGLRKDAGSDTDRGWLILQRRPPHDRLHERPFQLWRSRRARHAARPLRFPSMSPSRRATAVERVRPVRSDPPASPA